MKRAKRRGRRLIGWFVVGVVAASALWLAGRALCGLGGVGLCGWDTIERVEVRGTARLTTEQVRAWAAVPRGAPLWSTDGDAIVGRLEGRPWIRSVTVTKRFPDTVVIEVTERAPAAVASTDRGKLLVDADGSIIGPTGVDRGFPLILGASTSRPERLRIAARILAGFREADVSVSPIESVMINVSNPDDPVVQLSGELRVRMGRGEFAEKWRRVQAIHDNAATRIPDPRVVDLRFADRAVVTAWDGAL